jgi:hypothetical protein
VTQIIFVVLFTVLPVLAWWISRNATFVVVSIALGFGLAGNLVQTTISFGAGWTVFGMQLLVVGLLLVIVALAVLISRGGKLDLGSRSRQFVVLGIPAIAIGLVLILLRIMAPDSPGDLTAVGYLISHPLAEDNAKWLHLTSQLAQGTEISFNGYAGGPLLLLMSVVASLISVLSAILLGGVNEVAVATNTLIGTQFLLIVLIPFVFAVFAQGQITDHKGSLRRIPTPAIWAAMLVMVIASSTVTSFGHLSLQFVLIVLVLWAGVFILNSSFLVKLAATLVIATTASVWLPLNVFGLAIIVISLVVVVVRRSFLGASLVVLTAALSWDAIFSSALYVLGIGAGSSAGDSGGGGGVDENGNAVASVPTGEIAASTHLFEAPGGTEIVAPTLGVLAIVALLTVTWLLVRGKTPDSWKVGLPLLPIAAFGAYTLVITVGDAILTGGAPHYGGQKIMYAFVVMALVSTLSIALMVFEGPILLSFGIGAIFVLLTVDSILPRALSAMSPVLWPSVNASSPQYWAGAEVNGTALQPISKSPIACLTVPPQSAVPTALPFGQESYSCTRLMVGLNALEGKAGTLPFWLQEDWLSNRENWNQYYDGLKESTENLRERQIIMMGEDKRLQGLQPWGSILDRNIPRP